MGDYKEVRVERLYVKVPNTDKLRKNAAGRHRHLLADGWREVERRQEVDHIWVRFERTGQLPLRFRLPKGPQEAVRMERRPRGGFGGFGGGGRGGGGRGGGRGPAAGGRGRAPGGGPGGRAASAPPGTTPPPAPTAPPAT